MKQITFFVGIATFAIVRLICTALLDLLPWIKTGAPPPPINVFYQLLLGVVAALISLPLALLFLRRKWARITFCSLVCGVFGVALLVYGVWRNHLPTEIVVGSSELVFLLWVLCGVLATWSTEALAEVVQKRLSASRTAS